MNELYIILGIILGSALSLGLASLLFFTKKSRTTALAITLPLGAGALLGAALFDLLPSAIEHSDAHDVVPYFAIGFLALFMLERFVRGFHHHHEHISTEVPVSTRTSQANGGFMVAGDLLHNIIDGIAIGAAFLVSVPTGIAAIVAVSLHEIPKELGTFGILLSKGWRDKTVILANIFTAVGTVVAALITFWLAGEYEHAIAPLIAVTAGFFMYIAASDIIPDIHEQPRRRGVIQACVLVASVLIYALLVSAVHATGGHAH